MSKPLDHFPLDPQACRNFLMGGGIGVKPMIAMVHVLHSKGAPCVPHRLARVSLAKNVRLHVSGEGNRAGLAHIPGACRAVGHLYTCGTRPCLEAVLATAEAARFPDQAQHLEYFATPDLPACLWNHPFMLQFGNGRKSKVAADQTAAEVLAGAGIRVDVKCGDGICGVCKCGVLEGAVEHRDFVLSKAQRESEMILCQSRAAEPGGRLKIDL